MSREELNKLCNKEDLYAAATAWVCVQGAVLPQITCSHAQLGKNKFHSSREPQQGENRPP